MYCFPHSGGMPGEYLRWSRHLPDVEVWGVQLPGRGSRLAEPAFTGLPELVDAVTEGVDFAEPFLFFGHSLGALVAYETAAELRRRDLPEPEALVLSASPAPRLVPPMPSAEGLDDDELAAMVAKQYGPLPEDGYRDDPGVRALLFGALRADLEIVHTYQASPPLPLECPITVFGGAGDTDPRSALEAWGEYTTGAFGLRMFGGGHFYFREQPDEFFATLAETVRQRAARHLLG
jgi:surfactin synthase thioesterase subunit